MSMQYDNEFLLKLDKVKNRILYARVTALSLLETPIGVIEGRITQGSINVDGASAVRRTCSLSMVTSNFNYTDYFWTFNTKFKLEVGMQNTIDPRYPDIIWFKQGIFVITSFNASHSTNSFSISLQGKDKMCLLNGDVGGSLPSSVDFGAIEEEVDGKWLIRKIPIKDIIRNAVHEYGREPYHNIIIKDLDDLGLELLEYRYDVPMYLYRKIDSAVYLNVTLDNDKQVYVNGEVFTLEEIGRLHPDWFETLVEGISVTSNPQVFQFVGETEQYYITRVEYGHTAGYRTTDLVYAGDLIANIGESLTSILDKIKNMLGEFEYFYDIDGRFTFQKKQSFANTLWTPTGNEQEDMEYTDSLINATNYAYVFAGAELISAFNNNPNILNMRNDFSVWGQRKSEAGATIPIHLRYAVDKKPTKYIAFDGEVYTSDDIDWRELIYIMAKDYYKHNQDEDFEIQLAQNNALNYPMGLTGYEQYYQDIEGFWRQLYDPEKKDSNYVKQCQDNKIEAQNNLNNHTDNSNIDSILADWNKAIQDLNKSENLEEQATLKAQIAEYEKEILEYNTELHRLQSELDTATKELATAEAEAELYYTFDENAERAGWAKAIYETPETLNFWFDFLDTTGELEEFNVKNKGARTKTINDSNIKSIYCRETPMVVFGQATDKGAQLSGYRYIQVPNIDSMFSISSQGKSAKDKLDELIYQHGYCIETASITIVPIYHLQPNIRVYISNEETGIDGDYIITKFNIPLGHTGTMSLTATKAAENII